MNWILFATPLVGMTLLVFGIKLSHRFFPLTYAPDPMPVAGSYKAEATAERLIDALLLVNEPSLKEFGESRAARYEPPDVGLGAAKPGQRALQKAASKHQAPIAAAQAALAVAVNNAFVAAASEAVAAAASEASKAAEHKTRTKRPKSQPGGKVVSK